MFSPDGTRLAFTSQAANLVAGDANQESDLFVRDLAAGTTTLVSANVGGTGSGNTWTTDHGAFSPDGRSLAFTSTASDLVATDTNGASDVFLRTSWPALRAWCRPTRRAPTPPGGPCTTRGVERPGVRADGRHVAFVSYASDFGPTDTDPNTDIYLRDLLSDTTTMVSTNAAGSDSAGEWSHRPAFTGDSTRSCSKQGKPRSADTNGGNDVYVKDLTAGTVTLVSANADGTNSGNDLLLQRLHQRRRSHGGLPEPGDRPGADRHERRPVRHLRRQAPAADLSVTMSPLSPAGADGEVGVAGRPRQPRS